MTTILILLFIALGAAAYFAVRSFLLGRGLRQLGAQMKEINADPDTNRLLSAPVPDAALALLLTEINRELDAARRERVAFQAREQELRRQIANISHDLRTPLTSVLGYLELLAEEDLTEEERQSYLRIVRQRSRTLQSLITSFYDLSRLESGEYPLAMEELSVSAQLTGVLALFYRDFEEAGFDVTVRVDESLPPVYGSPDAVCRVFSNLLQNILHHGKSPVLIEQGLAKTGPADGLSSGGRAASRQIVTRIQNGVTGLTAEDASRVFERFFTADEMRTGHNTGLGMTIAQKLLHQMGHDIRAELTTSGENAVFSVEIIWNCLPG